MKNKFILSALLCTSMTGCVSWKSAENLTDVQLCERLPFAYRDGDRDKLYAALREIENRNNRHNFSLSEKDCIFTGQMSLRAEIARQERAARVNASLAAIRASQPITTTCNGFGSSATCTAY